MSLHHAETDVLARLHQPRTPSPPEARFTKGPSFADPLPGAACRGEDPHLWDPDVSDDLDLASGGTPGPAIPRPAAHRRGAGRPDRGDHARADGQARARHSIDVDALSARCRGAARRNRPTIVGNGEGRMMTASDRTPIGQPIIGLDGEVIRERRPDRSVMRKIPRSAVKVSIVCDNVKGLPTWIGVIATLGGKDQVVLDAELPWFEVGEDFELACPCGLRHSIDGGRVRSLILGLTGRGRAPKTPVRDMERLA